MDPTTTLSRRGFLAGTTGLVVAITADGALAAPGTAAATVNGWVRIGPDGGVTLHSNAQEMGQGAMSGVAQILAEELCLDWTAVRVEQAPLLPAQDNANGGRWTGGSASIRTQWTSLRTAGAACREMLVTAGARHLGVAAGDCRAEDGRVVHKDGRAVPYAAVAALAATLPIPANPTPLARDAWRLIGRGVTRKDIAAKVDGSATYAIDISLPGLLNAAIRQSPVFGGTLAAVDPAPALAVKGVRQVIPIRGLAYRVKEGRVKDGATETEVRLPDAVAVVATTWWAAKKGLDALAPAWNGADRDTLDGDAIHGLLNRDLDLEGEVKLMRGDDPTAVRAAHERGMAAAVRHVAADYATPYLAHAYMEPLSAVAHVRDGDSEIWTGSQFTTRAQAHVAALTGQDPARVTAHILYSGGSFGRKAVPDYIVLAAHLSRAVKAPVKLVYDREEDLAQGRYRAATAARMEAGLDARGLPTAIRARIAGNRDNGYFIMVRQGQADQPDHAPAYFLDNGLTTARRRDLPVPVGAWRAPGSNFAAFYFESFVDELALAAGQDPLAYRRRLLESNPRARRVLETAAARSGWGTALPPGHGRGVALWNSFGSIAAQVVEVALDKGRLAVTRVTCAFDCGTAVNPDSVRAQGEGSILMALSATLAEEVAIDRGAVASRNFDRYPILKLAQAPAIDITILDSPDAPVGGAGEPMVPPLPAALANAIVAAGGPRVRQLPLSRQGLTVA
ncbi:molybdopterin cofactor-binding domain-containing protein [Azospirillum sp. B4]|uniref:xanthine dehydrogenase family protein molybdopterin-binding subunit n=1 Tax=Azospirillum sp. B4 TaxID=95605 RepID=UPI0003465F86|nr:molybdopterin cofactor-binding domain-containing protein [Azospirillum sp. B4]